MTIVKHYPASYKGETWALLRVAFSDGSVEWFGGRGPDEDAAKAEAHIQIQTFVSNMRALGRALA